MNLTPLSEIVDKVWGPIGTPERDAMEAQLKKDMQAWHLGQEIKKERFRQKPTQEELGDRVGIN